MAIVVDVEQEPPCRPEWVREALGHLFEHVARVQTPTLSLPLLGHVHGGLQWDTSLRLTSEALLENRTRLPPLISLRMGRQYMEQAYRRLAVAGLMKNGIYPLFRS